MNSSQAHVAAAEYLAHLSPACPSIIDDSADPLERDWCFVFFWNSEEFLRTGEFTAQLAGNAPIIVPKNGDDAFMLGTHAPIDRLLDDYERENRVAP